jgi:sugar phosphate isomerase/epimerase
VAGHGVVPIRKCLSILNEAGYQGVVSYEFEGHEQNLPALRSALKFIRKAAE